MPSLPEVLQDTELLALVARLRRARYIGDPPHFSRPLVGDSAPRGKLDAFIREAVGATLSGNNPCQEIERVRRLGRRKGGGVRNFLKIGPMRFNQHRLDLVLKSVSTVATSPLPSHRPGQWVIDNRHIMQHSVLTLAHLGRHLRFGHNLFDSRLRQVWNPGLLLYGQLIDLPLHGCQGGLLL